MFCAVDFYMWFINGTCQEPRILGSWQRQVARVVKFCTVTPNICGPSVGNPCQLSGIQNCEVSHRFLEKLRSFNMHVCMHYLLSVYFNN